MNLPVILQLIVYCIEIYSVLNLVKENGFHRFSEATVIFSVCLFCLTSSPAPKDFEFTVIYEEEEK